MNTVLTAADWSLLQNIFDATLELPIEKRSAYLDRACLGHLTLRTHIDALLRSLYTDDPLLGPAIGNAAADLAEDSLPAIGDVIGSYRLLCNGEGDRHNLPLL